MCTGEVLCQHGGACGSDIDPCMEGLHEIVDVMVLVSIGSRVPHPRVASGGRSSEYWRCSWLSSCIMAVCASGYIPDHVYDAIARPVFRNASRTVAIPPQSSTRCSAMFGSLKSGMLASDGVIVHVSCTLLEGLGVSLGGVCGTVVAEHTGMGCIGSSLRCPGRSCRRAGV
jgi:hypothetical protein